MDSTQLAPRSGLRRRARRPREFGGIDHVVRLVTGVVFGFLIGVGLWDWLIFDGAADWTSLSLGRFAWAVWILPPVGFVAWIAGWTRGQDEVPWMGPLGLLFGIVHSGALYLLYHAFGGPA